MGPVYTTLLPETYFLQQSLIGLQCPQWIIPAGDLQTAKAMTLAILGSVASDKLFLGSVYDRVFSIRYRYTKAALTADQTLTLTLPMSFPCLFTTQRSPICKCVNHSNTWVHGIKNVQHLPLKKRISCCYFISDPACWFLHQEEVFIILTFTVIFFSPPGHGEE